MQRISRKISNDPVLLFDWIMCILFGLLATGIRRHSFTIFSKPEAGRDGIDFRTSIDVFNVLSSSS